MSHKVSLTCQSRKANIVIRKNIKIDIDKIKKYCDENFEKYAFIEHAKDILPQSCEVEGCHYHIVGVFKGSKIAYSTRLNTLCKELDFNNAIGIQIEPYTSLESSIQYLTHKICPEKTKHNIEEIITNIEEEEFMLYYNAVNGEVISASKIIEWCYECHNYRELLQKFGLNQFKANLNVIKVIFEEIKEERNNLVQFKRYEKELIS